MIDITRAWINEAACRGQPTDTWFPLRSEGYNNGRPSPAQAKAYAHLKRICAQCPVMHQCRRDSVGEPDGVWGGLDPLERKELRNQINKRWRSWPEPVRLRYGSLIARLRGRDVTWARIHAMTGFNLSMAMALRDQWEAHQAARTAAEKRATGERVIPLPTANVRPPWPEAMPDGDAWVWHSARIMRARYEGQNADGSLIKVRVRNAPGGPAPVWLPKADVDLRRQVQVRILVPQGRRMPRVEGGAHGADKAA